MKKVFALVILATVALAGCAGNVGRYGDSFWAHKSGGESQGSDAAGGGSSGRD